MIDQLTPGTIVKLNFPYDPLELDYKRAYETLIGKSLWDGFTHGIVVSHDPAKATAILHLFRPEAKKVNLYAPRIGGNPCFLRCRRVRV